MSTPKIIKLEVTFEASKTEVWNLLTNPEMTQQYMFGCEVLSDWNVGSPIHWKGKTEDGQEIVYVKGEVREYESFQKVTFTMFDPNMGLKDIPENYVNLTYALEETPQGTLLKITQGDYIGAEDAQKRFEDSLKGWEMVIPMMKNLLATKKPHL